MIAQDIPFKKIQIGDTVSFERTLSETDVRAFAKLTGDENPLHTEPIYAAQTPFQHPVVHGALLSSLCGALIGMHLPGKQALLLSLSLMFRQPAYAADELRVSGIVRTRSETTRVLTIDLCISRGETIIATGSALVRVRE